MTKDNSAAKSVLACVRGSSAHILTCWILEMSAVRAVSALLACGKNSG